MTTRPRGHSGLLALMLLVACGGREPLETWMLGTFSTRKPPGGAGFDGSFQLYEFREGGTLELRSIIYGNPSAVQERTWNSEEPDVIAIRPAPDENPRRHWAIERRGTCGPFAELTFHEGVQSPGEGEVFRGEACVRRGPEPPEQCEGCDSVYLEWCEGEPPPCDDGSEESSEDDG